MNLHDFEIITAITTVYQEDIENWILQEDDEILQSEFAQIVMCLYGAYMETTENHSLLDLINKKHIAINEVA